MTTWVEHEARYGSYWWRIDEGSGLFLMVARLDGNGWQWRVRDEDKTIASGGGCPTLANAQTAADDEAEERARALIGYDPIDMEDER